tara:strand:+ start:1512 stop:2429 length:918 start_codon:yes stop_codon:yes gene_type:complete
MNPKSVYLILLGIIAVTALVLGVISIVKVTGKKKSKVPDPATESLAMKRKSRVSKPTTMFFQTWKTSTLPKELRTYAEAWQTMNPNYKYQLFGNEGCRSYIRANFGERELKAFDTLAPGAFKADLFRYCVLYHEGGVYSDIDVEPLVPIEEFVSPKDDFVSIRERGEIPGVYQAFMVCQKPRLPFLKMLIDHIVQCTNEKYYPPFPPKKDSADFWTILLSITGPVALANCISNYSGIPAPFKPGISVIGKNITMKLLSFKSHLEVQDESGKVVLNTKVPEYKGASNSYHDMFLKHKIYDEPIYYK